MLRKSITGSYRKFFARPSAMKLNNLLLDCALNGLGVLNYEDMRVSGENWFLRKVVNKNLPNNPILFDVGANVGNYSRELSRLFQSAKIHAFEPNPRSFERLSNNGIPRVCVNNLGLSDSAGNLDLYDRQDEEGSEHASLYSGVMSELHHKDAAPVKVRLTTLDQYCTENLIERIDFLKIDTEGHEFQVLKGARRLIDEKRLGIVQFEFNEMNVISRVFCRDFVTLLQSHQFYRLLPRGMIELDAVPRHSEVFAFQNIVAIPLSAIRSAKRPVVFFRRH